MIPKFILIIENILQYSPVYQYFYGIQIRLNNL